MKSTAQRPGMPKEVEKLRASLDSRLKALEKALADPKEHKSLESLILDLARVATEESQATARHAVASAQEAAAAGRSEISAALEAEKVESAALRQVIDEAKSALKRAEAALSEERRAAEAAGNETAGTKHELAALRESLEQEKQARAGQQREFEATLERERAAAATVRSAAADLERQLEDARSGLGAARTDLDSVRLELDGVRGELDSARGQRDALQGDLDTLRRELDGVREDSQTRSETQSASRAEQERALTTAQDEVRSAEARLEQAIRERDAAEQEGLELKRQLELAESAIRERDALNRELQAAHEARDAAEVLEATRSAEAQAAHEAEPETVVDLTSITSDEERAATEQRIRALEQAVRAAELRAETAEQQLGGPAPAQTTEFAVAPIAAVQEPPPATSSEPVVQEFRGPARAAKRVAFKSDIEIQVDGASAKLVDLSMTGAQVLTPSSMKPNRLVKVTLPVEENAVAVMAKVMWARLEPRSGQLWYRAGVAFTAADPAALESFLSAHQK